MKKLITFFLLFSFHSLFAQDEFIPFESLEAAHKGTAAWNANGTGPEPAKTGHNIHWTTPITVAYYYIASRDYGGIDADVTAAALSGKGTITGFATFVTALSENGFSVTDITMKYGYQTLGNDVENSDWTYTPETTTETRLYTGGNFVIYLNGEAMVGGSAPNMNMTIIYNNLSSGDDDEISGVSEFVIPSNQSEISSAAVQACATAFLNDVGNNGIRYNFASIQPIIQLELSGSGRTGAYFIAQNGKFERGNAVLPVELTSFQATIISDHIQLNWQTATEVDNYGFEIEVASTPLSTNWETIGFVEGHGNSNSPKEYYFTDVTVSEQNRCYRLKQIDTDGGFEYSDIVTVKANTPKEFKLAQNHPNPFNPTTKISFSVPETAKVSLTVFNTIGQKVAELANGHFPAGNHSVDFNASSLTSGIYFYRLYASTGSSSNFSEIKKMILVK